MTQHVSQQVAVHIADEHQKHYHVMVVLSRISRYVALLAAWMALCGSLFLSEVLGWQPCIMCWYQRILMYPLAVILAVGILRRDNGLHQYVLPFALVGACTSLYHYLLVKTNWLPPPPCHADVPCTVDYLNWFGFINIPFLALTAFMIISVMMLLSTRVPFGDDRLEEPVHDERGAEATASQAALQVSDIAVLAIIAVVVLAFIGGARLI